MSSRILIIDYGSQYTQLIARRVREARVYSEIHPPTRTPDWVREWKPTGIILSGGPNSVYGEDVPTADPALLKIAPVLGIWEGLPLDNHGGCSGWHDQITISGGYRYTGVHELYLTIKAGMMNGNVCFD